MEGTCRWKELASDRNQTGNARRGSPRGTEPASVFCSLIRLQNRCAPVFQALNKNHRLAGEGISRLDMLRVVKERCAAAELPEIICNHTFRGTGITVFPQNRGSLEAAQDMANHSDPRITKLYDRRKDLATLSEIERPIAFE
jgi:hypothetical protein